MAMIVVVGLEEVEIDDEQGYRMLVAGQLREGGVGRLVKAPPVPNKTEQKIRS